MARMGIAKLARSSQTYYGFDKAVPDFAHIVKIAKRFPQVWESSKAQILPASSDVDVATFIKQCQKANLPEKVLEAEC
ncbi:hypothetical protein QFC22_001841 [Naganishia vaughanmartiniae]|uniref:Uncharacterized protein n=1 Tax=Naganishia vaughanmartiniae TaxID=1424756 RepID=A0ACC2XGA0_9TREE|nr:hypothetical protein QFC22_001841 [Naganishia vaughanmartiniae]